VATAVRRRTVTGMSDDFDDVRGPTMLAATNMLKPPPAVIGSLNKDLTLPRTVKLTTIVAGGCGAILGFIAALLVFGASLKALMYGPTLGAALGWAAVNLSPLPGESLAAWLGIRAAGARKRKLVHDGRAVRLYVGIAPLRRTATGRVRMLPGGVPVDAVTWDSRGFPRQEMPGADRLTAGAPRPQRLIASAELSSGRRRIRRRRAGHK
jgi:hypothetical protein